MRVFRKVSLAWAHLEEVCKTANKRARRARGQVVAPMVNPEQSEPRSAAALLQECLRQGIALFVENGRLRCRCQPDALTDELRSAIALARSDLISAVRAACSSGTNAQDGTVCSPPELSPTPAAAVPYSPPAVNLPPIPAPGARLYFGDASGRPCRAEESFHWTWSGLPTQPSAPTWFYTAETGVPAHELAVRQGYPSRCRSCAAQRLRVVTQVFKNGTQHLRLECGQCGRFVKMLRPPPGNVELEYRVPGQAS
jgi:hypothetical protein